MTVFPRQLKCDKFIDRIIFSLVITTVASVELNKLLFYTGTYNDIESSFDKFFIIG